MLESLLKINKLCTLEEFRYLLSDALSCDKSVRYTDLKTMCTDKSFSFALSFDGTIFFLKILSLVKVDDKGNVLLNCEGIKTGELDNDRTIGFSLTDRIINQLSQAEVLNELFNDETIRYDGSADTIVININLIPLKYSAIKQLLLDIGVLIPDKNIFGVAIIDKKYQGYFEKNVITVVKTSIQSSHTLDISQLKELLKIKEELGKEAEEFVLKFETYRLIGHPIITKVERISDLDVRAGYDINSFEDNSSLEHDRFIEVKSYSKELNFYWTKNEIEISEKKGGSYYLYLVDRDRMNDDGYHPIIIKNPHNEIYLNADWNKEAQVFICNKN